MVTKTAPQVKPRKVSPPAAVAAAKKRKQLSLVGKEFDEHDAAEQSTSQSVERSSKRTKKRSTAVADDEPLAPGERILPGRLTLEGRRGRKIVRKVGLQLERGRGRALAAESAARGETESTIVGKALAAYGIGGKYVAGEGS